MLTSSLIVTIHDFPERNENPLNWFNFILSWTASILITYNYNSWLQRMMLEALKVHFIFFFLHWIFILLLFWCVVWMLCRHHSWYHQPNNNKWWWQFGWTHVVYVSTKLFWKCFACIVMISFHLFTSVLLSFFFSVIVGSKVNRGGMNFCILLCLS